MVMSLICKVHRVSGKVSAHRDPSIDVGWDDDEPMNLDVNSPIA